MPISFPFLTVVQRVRHLWFVIRYHLLIGDLKSIFGRNIGVKKSVSWKSLTSC